MESSNDCYKIFSNVIISNWPTRSDGFLLECDRKSRQSNNWCLTKTKPSDATAQPNI